MKDPGHLGFDYLIRLSHRKTATIEVRQGRVLVAAPVQARQSELQQWVDTKADWIRQKLQLQAERQQLVPVRHYDDGEHWSWLGQTLTLQIDTGPQKRVEHRQQQLFITLSSRSRKPRPEQVKQALEHWYQSQALALLEQKTQQVCQRLQRQYSRVQLRRTKSKWGHCTSQGVIQYNWLIVQAPEWIVDYLVVHECCHLVHHNHSRAFWHLVSQLYPDYQRARHWLRQHGHSLTI